MTENPSIKAQALLQIPKANALKTSKRLFVSKCFQALKSSRLVFITLADLTRWLTYLCRKCRLRRSGLYWLPVFFHVAQFLNLSFRLNSNARLAPLLHVRPFQNNISLLYRWWQPLRLGLNSLRISNSTYLFRTSAYFRFTVCMAHLLLIPNKPCIGFSDCLTYKCFSVKMSLWLWTQFGDFCRGLYLKCAAISHNLLWKFTYSFDTFP